MNNFRGFVITLGSLLLIGEGAPDDLWDGGKLTPRRLDPSRPWLKPENNWGQGFGKVSTNSQMGRRLDPTRPHLKPGNNWGQGKPGSKPSFGTFDVKPGFGTKPFGKPGFGTKPFGKPGFGTKPFGKPGFGTKPFGKPGFGTKPFPKPGVGLGTKPWNKPALGSGWKPGNKMGGGKFDTKPWARPSGFTKDNKLAVSGKGNDMSGFKYGGSAKNLKFSGAGNPYTKDIKLRGPGNPWAGAGNPYTKPGKSPFKGGSMPCRPNRFNNFCGKLTLKSGARTVGRADGPYAGRDKPWLHLLG